MISLMDGRKVVDIRRTFDDLWMALVLVEQPWFWSRSYKIEQVAVSGVGINCCDGLSL
jgi:hypothetical protein